MIIRIVRPNSQPNPPKIDNDDPWANRKRFHFYLFQNTAQSTTTCPFVNYVFIMYGILRSQHCFAVQYKCWSTVRTPRMAKRGPQIAHWRQSKLGSQSVNTYRRLPRDRLPPPRLGEHGKRKSGTVNKLWALLWGPLYVKTQPEYGRTQNKTRWRGNGCQTEAQNYCKGGSLLIQLQLILIFPDSWSQQITSNNWPELCASEA